MVREWRDPTFGKIVGIERRKTTKKYVSVGQSTKVLSESLTKKPKDGGTKPESNRV